MHFLQPANHGAAVALLLQSFCLRRFLLLHRFRHRRIFPVDFLHIPARCRISAMPPEMTPGSFTAPPAAATRSSAVFTAAFSLLQLFTAFLPPNEFDFSSVFLSECIIAYAEMQTGLIFIVVICSHYSRHGRQREPDTMVAPLITEEEKIASI